MARKKGVKEAVEEVEEVIADGVVRDAGSENPIADNPVEKKPRKSGNWIKVTPEKLAQLEASGVLKGYDPSTQEALLKE